MLDRPHDEPHPLAAALAREQKKVALVQEVSRALSTVHELTPLLTLIMEKVTELMEADRSTLFLLSEDGRELWSKVIQGGEVVEIRLAVGEGIAGWVAESRQVVNLPDAYQDERFNSAVDLKSGYRTRSILCVPMLSLTSGVGSLFGVLQVLNKTGGPFTAADEDLLSALASQAAIAIENAKLYHSLVAQNAALSRARRELEQRSRELNALYEVEQAISAALDLDDLLERILAQATSVLGGGGGSIVLVEPSGALRFCTVRGSGAESLRQRVLPRGTGILGWSIAHKEPVLVKNPTEDTRHAADLAREVGVAPWMLMAAPLIDGEEAVGGIEILEQRRTSRDGEDGGWDAEDLRLLVLIAAQVAKALTHARARSEHSNRDRLASIGRMLAGVLHDVKTPMTIISGYAQLMASADDADTRGAYVDHILRQFELMNGMTKEVLAFSRGDTDLFVRKVYMHRFVSELQTQLAAAVAGRGSQVTVEAGYDGVAFFDEQKLLRVLHNLVRNAVEAMPQGGEVTVSVQKRGVELHWEISDNGPGIPAELAERLFTLFASGRKGGTGLGLAIVKKIVDDHGGRIDYRTRRADGARATSQGEGSDAGGRGVISTGTTFVIALPAIRGETE
jgi:signal transduction histidine kinase/putative methionine-R-sulfoxide reductase with GAF domain